VRPPSENSAREPFRLRSSESMPAPAAEAPVLLPRLLHAPPRQVFPQGKLRSVVDQQKRAASRTLTTNR